MAVSKGYAMRIVFKLCTMFSLPMYLRMPHFIYDLTNFQEAERSFDEYDLYWHLLSIVTDKAVAVTTVMIEADA